MLSFTAGEAKTCVYVCTALSLVILLFRLGIALKNKKSIDASFFLIVASVLVDVTHLVVNQIYLRDGTAADAVRHADYFNTHNAARIKRGSILSLVGRALITTACWQQICLMLLFYARMLYSIHWIRTLIISCWVLTILSYIANILLIFLECQPFHLYWQVHPDPGSCLKAYAQLLTQGISNIVIDLVLLAIAFPLLWCKRTWTEHFRVGILYTLGVFCIIVTILRLVAVYASSSAQPARSFWASIQIAVSTFVANAPTIYGDLRTKRRKKSETALRRQSATLTPSASNRTCESGGTSESSPLDRSSFMAPIISKTREWFDDVETVT